MGRYDPIELRGEDMLTWEDISRMRKATEALEETIALWLELLQESHKEPLDRDREKW